MSTEAVIYHITGLGRWEAAAAAGEYRADSLQTEGFIHASTRAQVVQTANRYYSGQRGLVLLEIEVAKVAPEIRYEGLPGGEKFPHIYGSLDTSAVVRVLAFEPDERGVFSWPEGA